MRRTPVATTLRITSFTVLLLAASACTTPGERVGFDQRDAPSLELGVREASTLECTEGLCARFYRLPVTESGTVSIEVDSDTDPVAADYGVALFDRDFDLLAEDRRGYRRPRRISRDLAPGLYYVRVRNLFDLAEPLEFAVRATLGRFDDAAASRRPGSERSTEDAPKSSLASPRAASPAPTASRVPPRRTPSVRPTQSRPVSPRPTTPLASDPTPLVENAADESEDVLPSMLLRSEVIEIERSSGAPVAVLIDAGAATGVSLGSRGRLIDRGREIGEVEIVDVYSGGSRARIDGDLAGEITDATLVEVFSPEP